MKKLGPEFVEILDEAYRNRLRALQAVDELVGSVFEQLEKQGKLDNTYIIYSADNGQVEQIFFSLLSHWSNSFFFFVLDIILANIELIQENVQIWKKISSKNPLSQTLFL